MLSVVDVARICHEANSAYRHAIGEGASLTWDAAPGWQKDSAIAGVIAHYDDSSLSAGSTHALWLERKAREGWTLGPRDDERKTHPCMVAFDELPEEQQRKDYLFKAICNSLRVFTASPRVTELT